MLPNSVLYGLHDEEAAHLVPPGGWCLALVSLSENFAPKDYSAIRSDINWILRINWGYGSTGTIPLSSYWSLYLERLAFFLRDTKGAVYIHIGNEPNHEQEWPRGVAIGPEEYAQFFVECYKVMYSIRPDMKIAPAPFAPYHARDFGEGRLVTWLEYANRVYRFIQRAGIKPDFISVHAYLRGFTPEAVWNKTQMASPLANTYYGFLTYLDALAIVPNEWRDLPAHITEIAQMLPDGWFDQNTGVVKSLYQQIEWHNNNSGGLNPIQSGILYRWLHDKWAIRDKHNVLQDFREAATIGSQSPQTGPGGDLHTILSPSIKKEETVLTDHSTSFESEVDERIASDIKIEDNGSGGWWVKKVKWFDKDQSGGRHHVYVEALDENGVAISGVDFIFGWPAKEVPLKTTTRYGFDAANQQFSPGRAAFYIKLVGGPKVSGLGMGQWMPEGFNPGEHTATLVTFQRGIFKPEVVQPEQPKVQPVPELSLPFRGSYPITQVFGVNEENYKKFKVDGVPLKGHNGLDFGTPTGTDILAVDIGKVIEIGNDPTGYGNYVKLQHQWGETLYAHLEKVYAEYHMIAAKGAVLGLSGNTGNSTGPHLHLGLRVFPYNRKDGWGGYSDPAPYLDIEEEEPEEVVAPSSPTIRAAIYQASVKYRQDYLLLASLAWAESSFRPWLKDGLFQIGDMAWSDWASRVGAKDRNDPFDNALVGAAYFRFLLNRYAGDYYQTLYAWNWGPGNVDAGGEPPAITKEFANKVLHGRDLLRVMEGG